MDTNLIMSTDTKKIYITHCSGRKNPVFKYNKTKVTPDKLYTASPTQRFINKCKNKRVNWAIFSDKYGVWFSDIKHEWYEKNPNKVTEEEFNQLVNEFNKSLGQFNEIYFYHNPGRFHKLIQEVIKEQRIEV